MDIFFIVLIALLGLLYVANWFIAYNHTKEGQSRLPFLTVHWLFKPEILDDIGNKKRKYAIWCLISTLIVLFIWAKLV